MATKTKHPTKKPDLRKLRDELFGLFEYVQRVRQEIAAISRPADEEHKLDRMNDQLDAIVKAAEDATQIIMEKTEGNEALANKLRGDLKNGEIAAVLDQMSENNLAIFEACSFQDITGQRVTKVVKSITYVESCVNALIEIWGKQALDQIIVPTKRDLSADEKLLRGPALDGEGVSQDEINKLFD